jgi:hypothetical protein
MYRATPLLTATKENQGLGVETAASHEKKHHLVVC